MEKLLLLGVLLLVQIAVTETPNQAVHRVAQAHRLNEAELVKLRRVMQARRNQLPVAAADTMGRTAYRAALQDIKSINN